MTTQIVAHRGDRKNAPENTLAAFRKALSFDELDILEIDVHLTKDQQLVVIHDEKIDRTTNGDGYVKDYTLAQLQRFDAGSWFSSEFKDQVISSLEQVLALLTELNFKRTLLIEVKTDHIIYPGIEQMLLNRMKQTNGQFKVIYQSFNLKTLERLHELDKTVHLHALVFYPSVKVWRLMHRGVISSINPDDRWPFNRVFWMRKVKVSPWTVNRENKMRAVFNAGLNRIITDEIAMAIRLRKEIQD